MGRVVVHLLDKPKDKAIASILRDYESRVRNRGISLEIHDDKKGLNYEARILALPGLLVLLSEEGASISSANLASWLTSAELRGKSTHLAIGPAQGFSDSIKERADAIISLSELTLTHEMAAAVLMEQLYRATEINRGSPYHRD